MKKKIQRPLADTLPAKALAFHEIRELSKAIDRGVNLEELSYDAKKIPRLIEQMDQCVWNGHNYMEYTDLRDCLFKMLNRIRDKVTEYDVRTKLSSKIMSDRNPRYQDEKIWEYANTFPDDQKHPWLFKTI